MTSVKFVFYVARLLWKHRRSAVNGAVVGALASVAAAEFLPLSKLYNPNKEGQS